MDGRKHLTKAEISGIVLDIRAGKPTHEIMGSWDVSASTVEKVDLAKRLSDERASADQIASYAATHSISAKMAEWITEEIDRLKDEEAKGALTEPEIVELENEAVNPVRYIMYLADITHSLMHIEDLLEKLLKCWGGTDGSKV